MNSPKSLIQPEECALLLIDHQAGLAFGVASIDRQVLLNNAIALAKTAAVFKLPVIVSTSASKVYSGPLMPAIQAALPGIQSIERRNMNIWEDEAVRSAVLKTQRRRLLVSGMLTEDCVSFPVLSALAEGYEVFVVGDAWRTERHQSRMGIAKNGSGGSANDVLDPGVARTSARLDPPRDLRWVSSHYRVSRWWVRNRSCLRPRHAAPILRNAYPFSPL